MKIKVLSTFFARNVYKSVPHCLSFANGLFDFYDCNVISCTGKKYIYIYI